ncbi:hypothetical protein HII36_01455 [Nonomuraea sp. NN258]|uniref:hypothetical protein n=1 Tax=Nonomuraea antri TaxID=2730852 RepID=UPI001567CFAE|nr:hypothetical protein [Nonomuraea antri]NRQ30512.1 hypothetical protein [Nonomuraea antri]
MSDDATTDKVVPRQIVTADSDSILQWQRMVYREFGEKRGLLRHPDITRAALHLAVGVSLSVNGRRNVSEVGIRHIARMVGYSGNGHDLYEQLDHLLVRGFLTKDGEGGKGGNAPRLALSVPCSITDDLARVKNSGYLVLLHSLEPEVVTVADKQAKTTTPPAAEVEGGVSGSEQPTSVTEAAPGATADEWEHSKPRDDHDLPEGWAI